MEPTGHCPFVGLKQNRAIRFSSPTPEHRCFVGGDPIEIPVDQATFCLSRNHTQCPLYMGLTPVTTPEPTTEDIPVTTPASTRGLRAWIDGLPPRDRVVYIGMLSLLALIVIGYILAGLASLAGLPVVSGIPTSTIALAPSSEPAPSITAVASEPSVTPAAPSPTSAQASPTYLPTSTPSPQPTTEPTRDPIYFPPTSTPAPSVQPSATALATPASATQVPTAQSSTAQVSTTQVPTAQVSPSPVGSTAVPTARATTQVPASPQPTTILPTATRVPQPTVAPANTPKPTVVVQPTAIPQPTAAPKPTAVPQPTAAPPAEVRNEFVWLYFGDTTGTLYVPVQRRVAVENRQSARAALLALIDGPHTDLKALVSRDTRLLGVRIEDGTAYANFDRDPSGDNERGYDAIVLTLTHFQTIERVQIQINGRNLAGARARPVVNPVNPLGLPVDARQTEFLPLYFLSNDGYHHIRIIRMVPKTRQTAEGTMRALLEGPGAYGYALQRTIPDGTDLRGISIDNGIVNVDLTEPFANASDRATVVRTVTESLTTLPGVRGVRFFIEGSTAGDWWGAEYGQIFERGLINGE